MINSGGGESTPGRPKRKIDNVITGVVAGSSVQAGEIHGGVHVHQVVGDHSRSVPRQLRPPPAHFTGRATELADLDRLIAGGGERNGPALVVVCGPGGVGKSALALRWLHAAADRYPDGQLYVDLGTESTEAPASLSSVLGGFLRALGVAAERVPVDVSEAAALFRSVTADKRLALLIDNAESAAQVRSLLPASPSSVVVVATRWRLGGLVMDGAGFVTLAPLGKRAGAELLAGTVKDARVWREPDAVATLVTLCGGLPIALSIAGARLAMRPRWPVSRVVRDLADERRRLAGLSMEHDTSVHGVFDLSYQALSGPVARAYRWLGLHPGPHFGVGVTAAALNVPDEEAVALLETLVDASLVEVAEAEHYRFHDLVRLHARHRSEQEDTEADRAAVTRRMLEYYLLAAVAADRAVIPLQWRLGPAYRQHEDEPSGYADGAEALDALELELPNLLAALRASVEDGLDELAWQLCEAMWSLFLYRKHFPDWLATYQLGIEAASRCGDEAARSRMHHHLGLAFHNLRRSDDAVDQGVAALTAARLAGNEVVESEALSLIGMANRARGHYAEALDVLRREVHLDHRAGLLRNEALGRRRLGQTLSDMGRTDEAIDELQRARELAAALPDVHVEANTMVWLAEALIRGGRAAEATDILREAWITLRKSGSSQYRAQVLMVWGEAAERLDDLPAARNYLTQARDLYTAIGAPHVTRVQGVLDRVEARLSGRPDGS